MIFMISEVKKYKIFKITKQSWSKIIFYEKLFLKSTRFYLIFFTESPIMNVYNTICSSREQAEQIVIKNVGGNE